MTAPSQPEHQESQEATEAEKAIWHMARSTDVDVFAGKLRKYAHLIAPPPQNPLPSDDWLDLLDQVSNWTAEFYKDDTPGWVSVMNPTKGSKPIKIAKEEAQAAMQAQLDEAVRKARLDEAKRAEKFSRNDVFGAMPISLSQYFVNRIKQLTNQSIPKEADSDAKNT